MLARFLAVALIVVCCSGAGARSSKGARPHFTVKSPSWQTLARKVGQSEEGREAAIQALRRLPTLSADLHRALTSSDRPLALEVIGALELRNFLPDLVDLIPADSDGFTALAVNGLMTDKTSPEILRTYSSLLTRSLPAPVTVALLEPMARKKVSLPRSTLEKLANAQSPDVRSALLYYLRIMALRYSVSSDLDLVTDMIRAPEGQLRLQAISVSAELQARPRLARSLKSPEDLNSICSHENALKEACLSFLTHDVAAAR